MSRVGEVKVWVNSIQSWMILNPADFVDRYVFVEGEYEGSNLKFLRSVCKPGSTFIDIGANIGWFTLAAAQNAGPTGAVYAFEPAPAIFRRLSQNVALNQNASCGSITLINKAVADCEGEVPFYESTDGNSGLSSMRDIGSPSNERVMVPVTVLDAMLGSLPSVTLIKMDIEGAEMKALRGMRALIERDHPVLVIELTDEFLREMGSSAKDLCELVEAWGYVVCSRNGNGELIEVMSAPIEQCDVICVHKELGGPRVQGAGNS
jgi:FkbM family methyltransferase